MNTTWLILLAFVCSASFVFHVATEVNEFEVQALRVSYTSLDTPEQLQGWKVDGEDQCRDSWLAVECFVSTIIHLKRGIVILLSMVVVGAIVWWRKDKAWRLALYEPTNMPADVVFRAVLTNEMISKQSIVIPATWNRFIMTEFWGREVQEHVDNYVRGVEVVWNGGISSFNIVVCTIPRRSAAEGKFALVGPLPGVEAGQEIELRRAPGHYRLELVL